MKVRQVQEPVMSSKDIMRAGLTAVLVSPVANRPQLPTPESTPSHGRNLGTGRARNSMVRTHWLYMRKPNADFAYSQPQ